ncbi:MAG: glutamate 5-kinase [Clostridiales bacterium]|nr:glutamate 5-kinase [Clostridiales bacterium]
MDGKFFKRIVIKVGTSTLTDADGKLNLTVIKRLVKQLVEVKNSGREVLLVTSGAIGAGMGEMEITKRPVSIPELQATAAIGQGFLVAIYNKYLLDHGERGAQILLTSCDLENRTRYLNIFNTLLTLLKFGVIPIINENDTVATQEIKIGDNDTLSARVAGLVEADLLIILSDVEGLYNNWSKDERKNLELIHHVKKITPKLVKLAGGQGSKFGMGGMHTKLEAAKIATNSGITMVIGPGYEENIIVKLISMLEEEKNYYLGTTFPPVASSLSKRKQWLCFNLPANGSIEIDHGAEKALLYRGKSLLASGIIRVEGDFFLGELVRIINTNGQLIGKGLVNYSAQEIERIKGYHSVEIVSLLGYFNQEEIIHRDNMVIEGGGTEHE